MHLSVDYWIERTVEPDAVLADSKAIAAFVDGAFASDINMVNLANYASQQSNVVISDLIQSVSKPHPYELFYRDAGKVSDDDYQRYAQNLAVGQIPDVVQVKFGLIATRANMRKWPTDDVVFKSQETIDLDRFQENGLFPADMVAILHASRDGEWLFVQSYNYAAWVRKQNVAIGDRDEILDYKRATPFLVVAANRARTNFNPSSAAISELQLDMGIRLPLVETDASGNSVDGQNTLASHVVRLPVRLDDGALEFRHALIARNQDVHIGYMPYTTRNVLHQAFKFLGERYGWGHSYNARDCTGLVQEVFKTFGYLLPRNSHQQGESSIGSNVRFAPDATAEEKLAALREAAVGDLVYSTGHVMLYLGMVDGEPYVIHDLSGSGWTDEDGKFEQGTMNGVTVTPMRHIHTSPDATYFDQTYAIKQLR